MDRDRKPTANRPYDWLDLMADLDAIVTDERVPNDVRDRAARITNTLRSSLRQFLDDSGLKLCNVQLSHEQVWGDPPVNCIDHADA